MNVKLIEEKLNLLKSKGATISQKQVGYLSNHYDPIEDIEFLEYYYSPDELILFAGEGTLNGFEGIAGYDFRIESASMYVKLEVEALMVITDKNDIQFFKEVVIDIQDNSEIDENGNYINIDKD